MCKQVIQKYVFCVTSLWIILTRFCLPIFLRTDGPPLAMYSLSSATYSLCKATRQGYRSPTVFGEKKKQGKSHFGTTNLVLKTLKNTHTHTHTGLFLDDQFAINYRFKPFHNIFLKFNMCYALKPIRIDAIKINPPPKKKMLLYFETKKQHNWSQENYLPILKIILKQMLVPKMLNNIS